jgi:hypothetical protein
MFCLWYEAQETIYSSMDFNYSSNVLRSLIFCRWDTQRARIVLSWTGWMKQNGSPFYQIVRDPGKSNMNGTTLFDKEAVLAYA